MKRLRKNPKITKGMPQAVLLSIAIHVALFLLAGTLVIFTVVKKKEIEFEPPQTVERPKVKLKKPKVKIKKTSLPKPTQRIVTKINSASMPEIQLPEMSGMGSDGFGGVAEGFDMLPDLTEVSVFGGGRTIGNDFEGVFYDLKRDFRGRDIPHDVGSSQETLRKFLRSGWDRSVLRRFYRSPKKLYTTTFAFPPDQSIMAPAAFGVDTIGWIWAILYKGQLVYPEDIKFRFWGQGDDMLAVRVAGKLVLLSVTPEFRSPYDIIWKTSSADSFKYILGNRRSTVGDWITLKAGEPLDMEVLVAEANGGNFCGMLCVEVEGVEYPKNPFFLGPTLPIFKTEEPSLDLTEAIHNMLDPGDASVTNGPIFRDYTVSQTSTPNIIDHDDSVDEAERIDDTGIRTWNTLEGRTFEAEYVTTTGVKVVLKSGKGKLLKIPYAQLSAGDRDYVDLARPPRFDIDFIKTSRQILPPERAPGSWYRDIRTYVYEFGVRLKQRSPGKYSHELEVEYFAIGDEVDGDNYVLLEREKSIFIPAGSKEYEFYSGKPVKVESKELWPGARMRGNKYGGYLVIISDERGKIIQHSTSNEFLFENIGNLRKLTVGRHFNKNCEHVGPPRPDKRDRFEFHTRQ